MGLLTDIIISSDPDVRNSSLEKICGRASLNELIDYSQELDVFRRTSENLYHRVRALFFLYAIHRYYLPASKGISQEGLIPFEAYEQILSRRFEEAINLLLSVQNDKGPNEGLSSGLAEAYHQLAFQTLSNQVRKSVRSTRGNQWMFRSGHPADHPLSIRKELLIKDASNGLYPIIHESTPVRMDITHSGWSDIFFLGMDFPQGAKVLNISIDLVVKDLKGSLPTPPIETFFRIIDEPVIKLTSIDLKTSISLDKLSDVFDFAKDYLGLLKAGIIASGIIPPGMEGSGIPMAALLDRITVPGKGIEIITQVNNIPKGSRLAVSTNLLASIISLCMRATGQTNSLTGSLLEEERKLVAARAILGEWLGGSGGGWQDSGGVWPGMKLIKGVEAGENDPEYGISNGRLLPNHTILDNNEVSSETRERLQKSLVIVHGGMAQDVGPVLEMVTEKYLLRSEKEWKARKEAIRLFDEVVEKLKEGNIFEIGSFTQRNFEGPIQSIIPWASNMYTEILIDTVRKEFGKDFWGFWMMGGMSGGGMGFIFDPAKKSLAQTRLLEIMRSTKKRFEYAIPFAMEPVVYDFKINEKGTYASLKEGNHALMPEGYYTLTTPAILKKDISSMSGNQRKELELLGKSYKANVLFSNFVSNLFERMIPQSTTVGEDQNTLDELLSTFGFDPKLHQQIRADIKAGRIGLAQNRLPVSSKIEDVKEGDVYFALEGHNKKHYKIGLEALKKGQLAVVSLAGGIGSRWSKGAGVVKSLNPFAKLSGKHRNFVEAHLAKNRKISRLCGRAIPHVLTTSYLTHGAIGDFLEQENNYNFRGPLYLSPGKVVGLRMIPMERDLRFMWEEMPQQMLDEQSQKVQDSLHSALMNWAKSMGEGEDYKDNLPHQCIHPVGHWYEVPNMLLNGTLKKMLEEHPALKHIMIHNIDTLGANPDPEMLGFHIESKSGFTTELISRKIDDRGGGLARIDGRLRLVEGLALPDEKIEFNLTYYNSSTFWVDIDQLLNLFKLDREDLKNEEKVRNSVWEMSRRMPSYITIKDVKKRWGKGQEDIYPVMQFEKLWGDMTSLPELDCNYVVVPRMRGQQLKEVAQLDGWSRDGSSDYLESLCEWD